MKPMDDGMELTNSTYDYPDFVNDTNPLMRSRRRIGLLVTRNRWLLALVSVVVLAIFLLVIFLPHRPTTTYQTSKVTAGSITLTLHTFATVQAALYDVTSASGAKISSIDVKVGQVVKEGDTVAKLDPTSLQNVSNQAQGAVNEAEMALTNAESNLANVQNQTNAQLIAAYDQEQAAIAVCNAPGSTAGSSCVQTAQDNYAAAQALATQELASAQAAVSAAQTRLAVAQAALQVSQDHVGDAVLTAPHDGTIAAINGHVGGTTTGMPFIQIVDLSALQIAATLDEKSVTTVTIGDPTTFTVAAYGNHTFHGTLATIAPIGMLTAKGAVYPVTIDVSMDDTQQFTLLAGMTAQATIETAYRPNVLLIPVSAVAYAQNAANHNDPITRSQAAAALISATQIINDLKVSDPAIIKDNPTASYVVQQVKGRWIAKPIVLGLTDGTSYEVLSGLVFAEKFISGKTTQ